MGQSYSVKVVQQQEGSPLVIFIFYLIQMSPHCPDNYLNICIKTLQYQPHLKHACIGICLVLQQQQGGEDSLAIFIFYIIQSVRINTTTLSQKKSESPHKNNTCHNQSMDASVYV